MPEEAVVAVVVVVSVVAVVALVAVVAVVVDEAAVLLVGVVPPHPARVRAARGKTRAVRMAFSPRR
jgi:hypothetical protein